MNVIEGAMIPNDIGSVTTSLSNKQVEELSATRVIFFAGDDIPFSQKNEMPSIKAFGGVFMPFLKTLPRANRGMLYRCQLTALRTTKVMENRQMLPPDAREGGKWEKGFIQSNAVRNADGSYSDKEIMGFQASDAVATKEGRFANKADSSQLFTNRYPGTDVRQAVKRSLPHGPGGVVEVTALKGATSNEIMAAQLFFFPDWTDIRKGQAHLPETIRQLEDHLKGRMKVIQELPEGLRSAYQLVGNAMLRSCQEFRIAYLSTFQKNEIILKDSAAKGNTGAYFPESAEQAMDMLEYKRKDDLVSGESSSVDRLARIMEKRESGEDEYKRKELELKEREIYLKEVELGIRQPGDVPVKAPVAPDPQFVEDEVTGQVQIVSAPQNVDEAQAQTVSTVESRITDSYLSSDVLPSTDVPTITAPPIDEPLVPSTGERLCGKPTANGTCARALKPEEGNSEGCWQHKG